MIRGILESARGVASDDTSEGARAARTIRGYGDLNGMEFLARVGVEKDKSNPRDEGRNVLAAAIGPEHPDYARLMGDAAGATQPTLPFQAAQATGGSAPAVGARPSPPPRPATRPSGRAERGAPDDPARLSAGGGRRRPRENGAHGDTLLVLPSAAARPRSPASTSARRRRDDRPRAFWCCSTPTS